MIETIRVSAPDGALTGARRAGESGHALVFVHGVGSTASIWDEQLNALSDEFRCAAVELRGNGIFDDPDPSLITREGFALDVIAACDALGFDRFTVVGCSLGGVVALELWQRSPERLSALAIVGGFARYPNAKTYAAGVCAAVLEAKSMRVFAEGRARALGLSPERLTETIEQMACKSVDCYLASTRATWTGDYRAILPAVTVPVLVLCGENDSVAPIALSQEIADGIPGARFAVVGGAGHVANADAPSRFNELLRSFLSAEVAAT